MSSHAREAAEARGRWGERRAALWLRMQGWRILAQRVKTPVGEIDLIARKGNLIACIEVKTRATARELDNAIDAYRLRRVAAAANAVAARYMKPGDDIRIDVILIAPRQWPKRIENAWMPMPGG